ncbi:MULTISPECIES: polysaccharide biosynthesis tyrosine autokinase [Pseudomonas]|uniref:polysaccharide biosynthesis tyrosine autokinase n=1 Tax=Pseudomonas TaxID=286 RepID=UPI000D00E99D|nr:MULTISPECIES: polysaccharide biosynthesis tyrosine autokinase [Pseudomonas]PRA54275.1 tyrosine-protein kinase [Pseudomonas sp. MYb115]QXN48549.1 polysaccharide biosynthesis tyrosine autokinase [Pseudomonas fluorescens]WSO22859.1 polysaccharide biosynthesis tyrosine autokinase [Pseudomonas fluorescens]
MQQQAPVLNVQEDSSNEIDLLGLVGTLIDHKLLIAMVAGAFMVAGAAYAVLSTPVYRANALVQVEAKKNDMLGFSNISSMLGQESPSVTEIELIKSRSVLGKAIDNLNLDVEVEPNYFPVIGAFIARRFEPDRPQEVAAPWFGFNSFTWGGEELVISELQVPQALLGEPMTFVAGDNGTYTVLDEDGNTLASSSVGEAFDQDGLKISVKALSANPGAEFTVTRQPRMATIIEYQKVLDVFERGKDSGILSLALEDTDADRAIRTLNEIIRLYVRQNIDRTSAEAAASLDFLREQLPVVKRDLEKAEKALNEYQIHSKSIDISLETKAILDQIVALDSSISTLKLQRAEMDRKFTGQHPAYRALMTQLAELTSKQSSLIKKVEGLPATQKELFSLTRDVQVGNEIYTQLLNKSQELDVMRAGTVGNVHLIDEADVDQSKPVKPQKALFVLTMTLLGAFFAIALVLLRKALNRGLESPEAIEQLGLPVYASIPYSALQKTEDDKLSRSRASASKSMHLLAMDHPTDLAIEALRSLRTSLHFATLEAKNNRLMISGPSPAVGKTFVSGNLAAVIAQAGRRVLLVDVDMRKGYLHKLLGTGSENGLSDVLSRQCSLDTAIHPTSVSGFDFISRGRIPPNPSELLMKANFTAFLDEVSSRYDLVILDTPPLLAVTDAAIVGRLSGTNLIVTRFGLNPAREIQLTMRRFAQNGIELKGAIFNGVEKRASAYGYGDYGYYHYDYKSDSA